MSSHDDTLLILGRIQGSLDLIEKNQQNHTKMLRTMDERLREVETKAAIQASLLGSGAALLTTSMIQFLKGKFGQG
ncbi:MAG: hypothetical protein HQL52_03465 [Magnetococcales bacterium]|nr:hypothetical protein [Magnetococcales bacterium]